MTEAEQKIVSLLTEIRDVLISGQADLLNKEEAAAQLRVNIRTVYQLVRDGKLKTKRIGRRVLFPRKEIERFSNQGLTGYRAEREVRP